MIGLRCIPVRIRLTGAFAGVMAVLFAGIAVALHLAVGAALLDEIDSGLRYRAEAFEAEASRGPSLAEPAPGLIEGNEAFAQVARVDGSIISSSPGLTTPLLRADQLARAKSSTFFERRVPGVVGKARLLAVPLGPTSAANVVIVGTTMSDRADALHELDLFLVVGGPMAIALASLAGWGVAGLALRPTERMREQALAISASDTSQRLSVPAANDELRRLSETLNDMLGRLDEAIQSERRLLDAASHELRTPLTALKAELDLALRRPRSPGELAAALQSASEETDRLAQLADDLLVLARAAGGRLRLHRKPTSLRELVDSASALYRARAEAKSVQIHVAAPEVSVAIDAMRVRQAIDNLLDNAIRFTPAGGTIRLEAEITASTVRIIITDDGPGFTGRDAARAFEPFVGRETAGTGSAGNGAGLGLAIVRAVAESHGGTVAAENGSHRGARVTMTLRAAD